MSSSLYTPGIYSGDRAEYSFILGDVTRKCRAVNYLLKGKRIVARKTKGKLIDAQRAFDMLIVLIFRNAYTTFIFILFHWKCWPWQLRKVIVEDRKYCQPVGIN